MLLEQYLGESCQLCDNMKVLEEHREFPLSQEYDAPSPFKAGGLYVAVE